MNLEHYVSIAAKRWPDLPALYEDDVLVHSHQTLDQAVTANADYLRRQQCLAPGSRVAIFSDNYARYIEWGWSIWRSGCTAVLLNARLHPREVCYILADSSCSACLSDESPIAELTHIQAEQYPSHHCVFWPIHSALENWAAVDSQQESFAEASADIAQLFYTSGTTGQPKGVMITHEMLRQMLLNFSADIGGVSPSEHILHFAPLSHGSGLFGLHYTISGAANVVPVTTPFAGLAGLLEHYPDCGMFMAPTMVRRMLDQLPFSEQARSHLKTILYAGGPMYLADIEEAVAKLGNKFVQLYGQGECPMSITCLSRADIAAATANKDSQLLASVGFPFRGVEVDVVDNADQSLPACEIGHIVVRGPTVMPGYWNAPEKTAETIRNGWLFTGDMGSFSVRGFLTLKDRSRDMIISGGLNIYPREVEEVLLTHPAVREASVIGKIDTHWGEIVVAYIECVAGQCISEAALDRLCLDHLARFKRPRLYRFIEHIPKNNYGKILKRELRLMEESAAC